jgi:hypothetical protein
MYAGRSCEEGKKHYLSGPTGTNIEDEANLHQWALSNGPQRLETLFSSHLKTEPGSETS